MGKNSTIVGHRFGNAICETKKSVWHRRSLDLAILQSDVRSSDLVILQSGPIVGLPNPMIGDATPIFWSHKSHSRIELSPTVGFATIGHYFFTMSESDCGINKSVSRTRLIGVLLWQNLV
ncbi:hypothetical protein V9T40_004579 [Parthenolecanium corni]|uniref:Uncharacterized protein n=1 Tax=Parthenolecanium corni TaxID=536013 RepID=A0AAN9TWK5_9HEMI